MKGMIIGLVMVVAAILGLVLMTVLFGGDSPLIDASIDTKAQIGIAISVVGIIGALVLMYSFWRTDQDTGASDEQV